jgi:site-specific recombinase XerD
MPIGTKLKGDHESDPGLFGLLASWERTLRGAKKSKKTINTYLLGVRSLNSWCVYHVREFALDKDLVLDYLIDSLESGLAASSLESYLKGIKIFAKWCHAEGEVPSYDLANVAAPKADEVILPSVSPGQWDALMATCSKDTLSGRRDEAILGLLRDTGLRARELVKVNLAEVDLREQSILAHGKGGRDRYVGYSDRTAVALDRYLRARRKSKNVADEPALLLSVYGGRFSYAGLYRMLGIRAEKAGLPHINPHMFRRMFANEALDNDIPAGDLKALGGWRSFRMVEHYAKQHENRRALKSQKGMFDKRDS